jgi:putative ABC transport system permease protein
MVEMGINSVYTTVRQRESNVEYVAPGEEDRITDEMMEELYARYPDEVQFISASMGGGSAQARDGHRYANVSLLGVNAGNLEYVGQYDLLRGRDVSARDVQSSRYVAGVSDRFVANMFPKGTDPIGKEIKVYTDENVYTFTIICIYKFEMPAMLAAMMPAEEDISTDLFVPITTLQRMINSGSGYSSISVLSKPGTDNYKLTSEVEEFFGKYYERNDDYEIFAYNNAEALSQMTTMMGTVQLAISVIAAISLLVGGIGVMNIMLVSVTERTREIGTRKALGARNSAIRVQFIVESMIICLIGGVIGIIVGLLLGYAGSSLMGFAAEPDLLIIVIAVAFSMVIGVFFGYYPANKAAKLDPIEALRYE